MGDEIKIRTVPRSNESKTAKAGQVVAHQQPKPNVRPQKLFVALAVLALAVVIAMPSEDERERPSRKVSSHLESPVMTESDERVERHLRELELQRELTARAQALENDKFNSEAGSRPQPEVWDPPKDRVYGLQLDQENSAEKVYEDLNVNKSQPGDLLPEDRINARLANAKWIREMERAEQKQFVANFVKSARENGYEVMLNEQLVVVSVKKLPGNKKVSIDKILDQLSRSPSSP